MLVVKRTTARVFLAIAAVLCICVLHWLLRMHSPMSHGMRRHREAGSIRRGGNVGERKVYKSKMWSKA